MRKRQAFPYSAMVLSQLVTLLMLCQLAEGRSMRSGMSPKQSKANVSTALYEETVPDMHVKYLGGYLVIERQWANGRWTFNPNWADLQFYRVSKHLGVASFRGPSSLGDVTQGRIRIAMNRGSSGNLGSAVPGDLSGDASSSDIKAIRRNSYKYEPADDTGTVFKYPHGKAIVRTDTGYRWQNRFGSWIDYDSTGRAFQFGNRNEQITRIARDADGNVESVIDHFGNTLVTFTYVDGKPRTVTDYSGRQVTYTWVGNNLTTVTDVRGYDWSYSYDFVEHEIFEDLGWRVIRGKTDPEGRSIGIVHKNFQGGRECVSGTAAGLAGGFSSIGSSDQGSIVGGIVESVGNGLSQEFTDCTRWMIGTPRVFYDKSFDTVGIIEQYSYFYNSARGGYSTNIEKAGVGVQSYVANLLAENTSYYLNNEQQYELAISADRRSRVHTDRNGYVTTQTFDEFENLTAIQYADGTSESWTYGKFSNVLSHTDARGVVTAMSYDDNGNLTQVTEAQGTAAERITQFTYDSIGRMSSMRQVGDANTTEAITRWTSYDNYGNPLIQIDPENIETRYTYDVLGNVRTYQDGRGNTWRWTYDALGNVLTEVDPLTHFMQYTYDKVGNLKTVTDALNIVLATYTYNARNRVTSVTNAYNQVKTFVYNNENQLVTIRDENNHNTTVSYDSFGRPSALTDAVGNVTEMTYGGEGAGLYQLSSVKYPTYTERYTYDRRYRIESVTQELSNDERLITEFRYDAVGNQTRVIDTARRHWVNNYDELNRLSVAQDPDLNTTRFAYDDRDNLLVFTNELNIPLRRFTYDRKNQLTAEIWPTDNTFGFEYDKNGNLSVKIDGKNQRHHHQYDVADRLVQSDYYVNAAAETPQKTVTFSYNDANSLTSYNDGSFSGVYTFDNLQRLISETVNYGAFSASHSYSYTPTGKKASLTHPDNTVNNYFYDDADKLNRIVIPGHGTITVNAYNWMGPSRVTYPGGTTQENTYDPLMRMTSINTRDPAGNTLMDYRYGYNDAGNIISKATEHGTYLYGYDNLDRLTSATNPTLVNEAYSYDPTGNRLTAAETGESLWQYDDSNQLRQAGLQRTYGYDANGSMNTRTLNGDTHSFNYNLENRLSEVRDSTDNLIASYHYDPFGRRVAKTVGTQTTFFHYSDEGLVAEFNSAGASVQGYAFQPDSMWGTDPTYTKVGNQLHYYANDHLGTPQKLVDSTGSVGWSGRFSAFGLAEVGGNASIDNSRRFAGHYADEETGLIYNFWRSYDSGLGRYLQTDRWGLVDGPNTYAYARSNPANYIDPTGEFVPVAFLAIRLLSTVWRVSKSVRATALPTFISSALINASITGAATYANGCNPLDAVIAGAASGAVGGLFGAVAGPLLGRVASGKPIPIPYLKRPEGAKPRVPRAGLLVPLVGAGIGAFSAVSSQIVANKASGNAWWHNFNPGAVMGAAVAGGIATTLTGGHLGAVAVGAAIGSSGENLTTAIDAILPPMFPSKDQINGPGAGLQGRTNDVNQFSGCVTGC